jgi:hypothetical protein
VDFEQGALMFTGLIADQSPKLRNKADIREARALFIELNSNAPWAVGEVERGRRFTEAELGHMRAEKVDWERAEARDRANHDAFAYG